MILFSLRLPSSHGEAPLSSYLALSPEVPGNLFPLIERTGLSDLFLGSVDVLHTQDLQPFPECPRHSQ